jgi:hypothetical protein
MMSHHQESMNNVTETSNRVARNEYASTFVKDKPLTIDEVQETYDQFLGLLQFAKDANKKSADPNYLNAFKSGGLDDDKNNTNDEHSKKATIPPNRIMTNYVTVAQEIKGFVLHLQSANDVPRVVHSFPLLELSQAECDQLAWIRTNRCTELIHMKATPDVLGKEGVSWRTYADNSSTAGKKIIQSSAKERLVVISGTKVEEDAVSENKVHGRVNLDSDMIEEEEAMSWDEGTPAEQLLYPPMAVRTDFQRKTQCMLLSEVIREHVFKFNEEFDLLLAEKKKVTQVLKDKIDRAHDILHTLGRLNEIATFSFEHAPKVLPDNLYADSNGQPIPPVQYDESHKMVCVDQDYERGLMHMMGGKLKGKREVRHAVLTKGHSSDQQEFKTFALTLAPI